LNGKTKKGGFQKSVLVTGASTGIGWTTSLELAGKGWRVFASVRKEADAKKLRGASSGKITPVIMDIVDYESVKRGAREIEKLLGGAGLDGLFNNAGISVQGPMEIIPIEMFEQQLRVNVSGQVFVTQTFLPLVRAARGRIVFMSSENGRITTPLTGHYSASKHAIEAVANSLRMELRPFGIRISLIEAGTVKTAIWEKYEDFGNTLMRSLTSDAKQLYATELNALANAQGILKNMGFPAKRVARAAYRALTSRWPKARYVVGNDARALILFNAILPTWMMDRIQNAVVRFLGKQGGQPPSLYGQSQRVEKCQRRAL
jgi:NAD(P)-dependent dehydrogenase (short-subunit alcohol dehydrogenase family)